MMITHRTIGKVGIQLMVKLHDHHKEFTLELFSTLKYIPIYGDPY